MQILQPGGGELTDDDLESAYDYPFERTWARLNFVATVDGAVTDAAGHPSGISSPADQRVFHLLRGLADVIVVGAGTARAEQYAPVRPAEVDQEMRARLGLAPLPPIAVVTGRLDIPESLLPAGDAHARTLVVTSAAALAAAPDERRGRVADRAEVLVCGDGVVDMRTVREELAGRGLRRVLAEGGPRLAGDLVAAGVVDEVCLTVSARLMVGSGPRLTNGPELMAPLALRLAHVLGAGEELLLRYVREGH